MKSKDKLLVEQIAERLNKNNTGHFAKLIWFKSRGEQKEIRIISETIEQKILDRKGKSKVTIVTKYPLATSEISNIKRKFAKKLGGQIVIEQQIDESILGGIKIKFADELIDLTWNAKLNLLRERIKG